MHKRQITKIIIAVVVIGIAGVYLLYSLFDSGYAYYWSVDEYVDMLREPDGNKFLMGRSQTIRLAGRVKAGSVTEVLGEMLVDFELEGQRNSLGVRFRGVKPKNFSAGREVVIEGKMNAGELFEARKILTRCESKYRTRLQNKVTEGSR